MLQQKKLDHFFFFTLAACKVATLFVLLVGFLFHSELTGRERLSLMCGRSEEMWVFAKGKLEAQRITGGGVFLDATKHVRVDGFGG